MIMAELTEAAKQYSPGEAMNSTPNSAPLGTAWARFDNLRENTAFRFDSPHRVLTATHPSEVAAALAEVDRATRAGRWAYGYVGYGAAPGLDDSLVSAAPTPAGPPLRWFGLCAEPTRVPVVQPAKVELPAPNWRPDWDPAAYQDTVRQVRDYIAAGGTYQTNVTVRLS